MEAPMDQHTYDLAFVGPKRRPRTAPEIVFIIKERHLPEVVDRLHQALCTLRKYTEAYLGTDGATFALPIPDLFGNKEFGFARCGYWTEEIGSVHLRLPMRPYPATTHCVLTILLLARILHIPFSAGGPTNQRQMLELMTVAEHNREGGYGHAVGGWLSEDVLKWLKEYAAAHQEPLGIITNAAPLHPAIISAMQSTAQAIQTDPKSGYIVSSRSIYGWIRDSGAFTLNCAGDACDLSVYPDKWLEEGCERVEMGCHNLDTAVQQLTLLAGLAKLLELARASAT
jgi:hypothetical protein